MARRPRHFLPGATYHIMLRGNNAQPIFQVDGERSRICLLIQEGVERFGHRVVAFCFMTNHIHLAIQVKDVPISRIIQNIAFRYTRFFNRRHDRVGHLFQGRFQSVLVDSRCYLKTLIRYIHLNPVQAGIVDKPQDYRWSSHRAYLLQDAFAWLSPEIGLANFGQSHHTEIEAFHRFVMAGIGLDEAINFESGSAQGILGSDIFIEQVAGRSSRPPNSTKVDLDFETLVSAVAHHYGVEPAELQTSRRDRKSARIRAITALLAKDLIGTSLQALASFFGRDPSVFSRATAELEAELRHSNDIREEINALTQTLLVSAAARP